MKAKAATSVILLALIATVLLLFGQFMLFGQTSIQSTYDIRGYQFTFANGSGVSGDLSAAGAGKVLTFTRGPKGIRYTASYANYLYIYGTGTPEAALITATTCALSGGSSCTVTVTTSNTHAGVFYVASASSGLQETINTVGVEARVTILIPSNAYVYAPVVSYANYVSFLGLGVNTSLIRSQFASGAVLKIDSPPDGFVSVSRIRFQADVAHTSGAMLHIKSATVAKLEEVRTTGSQVGIEMESVTTTDMRGVDAIGYSATGIWLKSGAAAIGGTIANSGAGGGTDLASSVGLLIQADLGGAVAGLQVTNFTSQTGAYGISMFANEGSLNEVEMTNIILDGLSVRCVNMALAGAGSGNGIFFTNVRIGGSPSAQFTNIPRGFQNVVISNLTGASAGTSVVKLSGAQQVTIANSHISGTGNAADIPIEIVADGSGNVVNNVMISQNSLGYGESGTGSCQSNYGISTTAVAHTAISITGNRVCGSTAALLFQATGAGSVIDGGNVFAAPAGKPTCTSAIRGSPFYTPGGAGVADLYEVCQKNGADVYSWVGLF
jgi:hypothetical protein